MESNKKRPEWWLDPVANWRSHLADLSNKPTQDNSNRERPSTQVKKTFWKVRSNRKCQK